MRYKPTFYRWSPDSTPTVIRNIIWATVCISLLAAVLNSFFHFLGFKSPEELLGLSWAGLQSYFLWQPITYFFLLSSSADGIHFTYLLTLFVSMYLLWLLGTMIEERAGTRHFLVLYFASGILSGLTALLVALIIGKSAIIAGPAAAILAVCMVWTMYFSDSEITIFFLFPVQAKWLMAAVLGAVSLLSLVEWDLPSLTLYLSGTIIGYLYGLFALGLRGPFEFTKPLDESMGNLGDWIQSKTSPNASKSNSSKIIDLRGNAVIDDEAFVDAMLSKIAKYGERSLSQSERKRMDQISERKSRERMDQ